MWSVNLVQRQRQSNKEPDRKLEMPATGILLVEKFSNQMIVRQCCNYARQRGVQTGMTLALARALLPQAQISRFNPDRDKKALRSLARYAMRFTPAVGIEENKSDDPLYHGLILDISGTERLHKSEEELCYLILKQLKAKQIQAKLAIAPTVGAAWALSRYKNESINILKSGSIEKALSALPVQALRINQETTRMLAEVGIVFVEDLLKIAKQSLYKRYGPELLLRLNQSSGRIEEPIKKIDLPSNFDCTQEFDPPLEKHESIHHAIMTLMSEVFNKLAKEKKKAGYFALMIKSIDINGTEKSIHKEISLHTATESFSHIANILFSLIESLQISGNVALIAIRPGNIETSINQQDDFIDGKKAENLRISEELLNNLFMRLGENGIKRIRFEESYIPEKSFSYSSIKESSKSYGSNRERFSPERPPYLLPYPQEIKALALMPDKHPSSITWKGKQLKITKGTNLERISEEWWQKPSFNERRNRDYFKVQDQYGRWLWVFRQRASLKWYVHGLWV